MFLVPSTQIWPWCNAGDAHFAHVALHRLAADGRALLCQLRRDAPRTIERPGRVELVDAMLDDHLLGWSGVQADNRDWSGSDSAAPPAHAAAARPARPAHPAPPAPGAQLDSGCRPDFFFSQFTCVVRRPISAYSSVTFCS